MASVDAVVVAAAEEDKKVCKTCQMEFNSSEGRQHGPSFECVTCSSADRLLRRSLGDRSQLQSLSKEEQVEFFKKLHAEKEKGGGKLNWVTMKAQLLTSLTTKQVTTNSTNINTKFLPLSVYTKDGWPEEVVKRCPSEHSEVYGCMTYQVPVKSKDWGVAHQEIKERILLQERQATAARSKKRAKGKDGQEENEELDLPAAAESSGKKAENTDKEEKKAAKEQASLEKKNKTHNAKQQMLAAKSMGILTQDLSQLQKLMAKVPADKLEGQVLELCQKTEAKLKEWSTAAKMTMQGADQPQAQSGQEKLPQLSFEAGDVKAEHLSVVEILKTLRAALPAPKAKAKAKAAATAATPAEESSAVAPTPEESGQNAPKRRRMKGNP
eukprot:s1333_g14.t1